MKTWAKYAVTFVAVGAIVRMVIFYAGLSTPNTPKLIMLLHLMLILLTIFLTVRSKEFKQEDSRFQLKADLKNGLRAGGLYAILTTAFVFLYFKAIDTNYLLLLKQERIDAELKMFPNADETQIHQITSSAELLSSISFYCTITTLGLMLATFTYTVMVAVINRYVLSRLPQ